MKGMIQIENRNITFATITSVHRERYGVLSGMGEGFARLKTSEFYEGNAEYPTVGDKVEMEYISNGDSRIIKTLPRLSIFTRTEPGNARLAAQAVAANFDYVFIVQSMNKGFNIALLERYLASAWQTGAEPVVVLTKLDICENPGDYLAEALRIASGVQIFAVSAITGEGMDAVLPYFWEGKTVVLLGSSGAGKSTLVNAVAGETVMSTAEIREDDARGRHTTTHRQLLFMPQGGRVIDTPGMRELGLWDAGDGLRETFKDVEEILERGCRFSDCKHEKEPGCALRAALVSGELEEERWARYKKLERENMTTEQRAEYYRTRSELFKTYQKNSRERKKAGLKKGE